MKLTLTLSSPHLRLVEGRLEVFGPKGAVSSYELLSESVAFLMISTGLNMQALLGAKFDLVKALHAATEVLNG